MHSQVIETRLLKLFNDARVNFFGNVKVGRDITVSELRKCYNAVILACGAEDSNRLDIPGQVGFLLIGL